MLRDAIVLQQMKCATAILLCAALATPLGSARSEQAVENTAAVSQPSNQAAEMRSPPAGGDYVIGPGDQLRIFVLQNPELSAEVPVRPDGRISTPLVNDMTAAGRTPSELAHELETRLSDYVRNPVVNVIVTRPTSAFSQVKVVGQAVNPKAIPYRAGLTVLDVLIEVGGLSQFAAGNRAKIIRTEKGSAQVIKIRLLDLLNKGDISQNLPMQPGDVLVIPESYF
jgi:polysaccharide export outer membrane protein